MAKITVKAKKHINKEKAVTLLKLMELNVIKRIGKESQVNIIK